MNLRMDNEKQKDFVPVREASKLTGLAPHTIRKMADEAIITCYRTPSGQRRINLQSIQKFTSNSISIKEIKEIQKEHFIYARVSLD